MIADNDGPAFPFNSGGEYHPSVDGMTLRDYFAAKAMQSLCPLGHDELQEASANYEEQTTWQLLAEAAYQVADAMLKVRQA